MKTSTAAVALAACSAFLAAAPAFAQSTDLAKSKGCVNCHDVEKKKAGPSIKDIAAKNKPASEVIPKLKDAKGHPKVNASEDELKSIYDSMLATK
ncbi:MAG: c-type cytochrome [Betaproteobacteria bacterium]